MFGGIPFEHFAHGGMGGPPRQPSGPADTTKLYETLEVEKTATQKEIKKAYFRLSKQHHPDKGGEEHKFKENSAAYEILSDEQKRAAYDKYGLEGVDDDPDAAAARGEDLFSMFFGGGGRGRRSSGPRKGPSVNHPIKVSLEDLFNGKTVKLAVNRKVIVGEVKQCNDSAPSVEDRVLSWKCDKLGQVCRTYIVFKPLRLDCSATCTSKAAEFVEY